MKIRVTKDEIKIEENSKIHKGEYNATKLEFIFSEEYDGLTKKAIFEADKDKLEVSIVNDECYIPATILSGKTNKFNLRVYATENSGTTVIKRYSPSYISIPLYNGSYIGNTTPVPSGDVNLQNKSITITENGVQTITADTGYDGLESVEIDTQVSGGGTVEPSKSVEYTANDTYTITPDEGYDGIAETTVVVNVPDVSLQSKSVSYTANDTYIVTPDEGYDGIDSISIEVDVPSSINNESQSESVTSNGQYTYTPSSGYTGIGDITVDVQVDPVLETQSESITQNGIYSYTPSSGYDGISQIDIDVQVSGGGSGIDLTSGVKFANSNFNNGTLPSDIVNCNWDDIYGMDYMFYNSNLTALPTLNISSNLNGLSSAFEGCQDLITVNSFDTSNVTIFNRCFAGDSYLENVPQFDMSSAQLMGSMFENCNSLTNASLNNILAMCAEAATSTYWTDDKTFANIGLSKTQVQTCQTLSNYQDAVDAGWVSGWELTINVDLAAIRAAAGLSTYTVPTLNVLDGYLYKYGVELTLNDPNTNEQVVGEINYTSFTANDNSLSFDIDYTNVGVDNDHEYYFQNIVYNPPA